MCFKTEDTANNQGWTWCQPNTEKNYPGYLCVVNWKRIWGLKHNFCAQSLNQLHTHNIISWALVLKSVTRLEQWAPTMLFPPSRQCVCTCLGNRMSHCEGSTETLLLAAFWVGGRERREGSRVGKDGEINELKCPENKILVGNCRNEIKAYDRGQSAVD